MKLWLYLSYLYKYYRFNKGSFVVSIICLMSCYLAVGVIFSFSAILEKESLRTFERDFPQSSFILAPVQGITFNANGQLNRTATLSPAIVSAFREEFPEKGYLITKNVDQINFISVKESALKNQLKIFCNKQAICWVNSFKKPDNLTSAAGGIMYNVSGSDSRFSVFSFQSQISAFILGDAMSTNTGFVSRFLFFSALFYALYIALLYFNERKTEFSILIIQGETDVTLKIIFWDCLMQHLFAFILSTSLMYMMLKCLTSSEQLSDATSGLIYVLPYFPAILILQLLLLLNRSMQYASNFE